MNQQLSGPTSPPEESFASELVRGIFLLVACVFAVLTIWTHLSQVLGISFRVFSGVGLALTAVTGFCVLASQLRRLRAAPRSSRVVCGLLGGSLLAGAVLALVSLRPDADEVNYAPIPVHYLDDLGGALGFQVHYFIGEDGKPATSLFQSTALAYEYVQGACAWLTGLPYLDVRYFLFPACVGALLPLAWFYLLRRFERSEALALLGSIVIFLLIPLLGETHRAFGNYAFNRVFQAKAVFLTLVLPLYIAAALDFLERRSKETWCLLFALAVCSVGLTASSIPMIGILAGVLLVSKWVAARSPAEGRPSLGIAVAYSASMGYMLLYAAFVISDARKHLRPDGALNAWWPTTFGGHWDMMFDGTPPASGLAMGATTLALLILARGSARRFFATWIALLLLFVLNPIVAPFLIEHVTSSNIYWRLFYLWPFPLAAGLVSIHLGRRLAGSRAGALALAAALLLLIAPHFIAGSPSVFRTGTRLGRPAYQLNAHHLRLAREVAAIAPAGTMFAPIQVSGFLPMISAKYPQLLTRLDELRLWVTSLGASMEVANDRLAAAKFLNGEEAEFGVFERVMERHAIRTLVLKSKLVEVPRIADFLRANGYRATGEVQEYTVLVGPADGS